MSGPRFEVVRLDDRWPAVMKLLDLHWPGLSQYVELAEACGVDWRRRSRPYGLVDGDAVIAHVGVMPMPTLRVDGHLRTVSGIHAVCTHPEHRRRGLARRVLAAALAEAELHDEGQLLFATEPRVYEAHGFRRARPVRFASELSERTVGAGRLRPVDVFDERQRRRALEVYAERIALSARLSVMDGGWLMLLDEILGTAGRGGRLWWYDDDTVIAGERLGREIHLYDLATRTAPRRPVMDYAQAFEGAFRRVFVYFDVDDPADEQLTAKAIPFGDVPMIRVADAERRWAAEGAFALSPLAHC